MRIKSLYENRKAYFQEKQPYKMRFYKDYKYHLLSFIIYRGFKSYNKRGLTYNDCFIMADTETSKKIKSEENHIVAWTISIRAFNENIVTLWGRKPSEFIECLNSILKNLKGNITYIYFHNLAYDYMFLRKFLFKEYGYPVKQLNTKSHYPINIEFENGLVLKDSLILSQTKLEKWANDLDVDHKKATGKWEYNKIRNQLEEFTSDELEYIEHDTLAGVECINKLAFNLGRTVAEMPYTATGIPRNEIRAIAKDNRGHEIFTKQAVDLYTYENILLQIFHGGYTHANRHIIGEVQNCDVSCYDFVSSYIYSMLVFKYPSGQFQEIEINDYNKILEDAEQYAFIFKLILVKPRLKNDDIVMPALQISKLVNSVNIVPDNGRVLCAEYVEIYLNEIDLAIIIEQYDFDASYIKDCKFCFKQYLPRYFTDYVYSLFYNKCTLKGKDPTDYALSKSKLNSCYGMLVQRSIQDNIIEDFETGEYIIDNSNHEELYDKYLKKYNTIFNYQHGCWVTSYSFYNVMQLIKCCTDPFYSDTDSCYGTNWDLKKIEDYNNGCKQKLLENNYPPVVLNGKEFWLGLAELDGVYSEFVTLGAKRYCCRYKDSGKLKITVAGVPKIGVECLKNDINNFQRGFIFSGEKTGKVTHKYIYVDEIYTDNEGNETGDSIDLQPCDYLLDSVNTFDWEKIFEEEINIIYYE